MMAKKLQLHELKTSIRQYRTGRTSYTRNLSGSEPTDQEFLRMINPGTAPEAS
jgi:hypothetical protein